MTPASAGILDDKSVTAALTGLITMVTKLKGRNSSILHGEVFGLIMGHILSPSTDCDNHLYTEHLNSVRFLQDSRTRIDQVRGLRYRNWRSYLRWLDSLSKEKRIQVEYTRGHSNGKTLDSKLNADADHFATIAQKHILHVPVAPIPTFVMNDFTYHLGSSLTFAYTWINSSHGKRQQTWPSVITREWPLGSIKNRTHHRMSTIKQPPPILLQSSSTRDRAS
jgi:hypothetical protein